MKRNLLIYLIPALILLYGCKHSAHTAEDSCEHEHAQGHSHSHSHNGQEGRDSDEGEHYDDEIIFTKAQAEIAGLKVEEVKAGKFREVIKASGQILAAQGDEATIVSTANGIVTFGRASIIEGSHINKGEAVVIISTRNLPDGDPVAKAQIAYETAGKEKQRAESLVRDKIMSDKEYEQVLLRYETARTVYEAQAGSATDKGIKVAAPIGGYIKNRRVNQGDYVTVGQEIATVSQNKRLQLRAEVSESNFKSLKNLNGANFKAGYDDRVYKLEELNGRLISFGKASGSQSFYIPVTFEFDNKIDVIPGTFVEAFLLSSVNNDAITVPLEALTEEQGLRFVYIKLDDEGYRKQEVTVGQDDGERVEILSGLKEGDEVVTRGVYQVKLASLSSALPEGHTHSH